MKKIRKKLLSEFNLHTILRLPTGIFYAQGVKANVLFFDKFEPLAKGTRTKELWVYDLRTNMDFSLVSNPLQSVHLQDFEESFKAGDFSKRKENERFKCFKIEEILKRDKINLDIFWLKEQNLESSENLPSVNELTRQICANLKEAIKIAKKLNA